MTIRVRRRVRVTVRVRVRARRPSLTCSDDDCGLGAVVLLLSICRRYPSRKKLPFGSCKIENGCEVLYLIDVRGCEVTTCEASWENKVTR